MRNAHRSARTIFISCTTALMLALGFVSLFVQPAQADRNKAAARRLTPKEEALVELGRRLFFDPLVSRSGSRSCASCHDPEHGFSDPSRVSEDDFGKTRRHSQTLLDGHLNPTAHWDGEFETVEELVLARIGALKGRRGKLGHGASVLDVVMGDSEDDGPASVDFGEEPDGGVLDDEDEGGILDEEEEGLLDEDEETGGGDDDENPYGPDARAPASAAPAKDKDGKAAAKGPTTAPSGPAPAAKEPAAQPTPQPKQLDAEKSDADKNDAAKKAAPDGAAKDADKKAAGDPEKKKPTPEELKAKAAVLRRELKKLPLASVSLEEGGRYREAFEAAFGSPSVSTARIARAISAYCQSIRSTEAPVDRFLAGDKGALSDAAVRGMKLFQGRANCASCHTMEGKRPAFTDFDFHNTGVVWNGLRAKERKALLAGDDLFKRKRDDLERHRKLDGGRARVSTLKHDVRAFKTPTLRDLTRRGPYMHDGRFATLADVVRYYAKGASLDPQKDTDVHAFTASDEDVADLVAFLESLTGDERPGLPAKAWKHRSERTHLRFVDADGRPLEGLSVRLTPVGDRAARTVKGAPAPVVRTTNAKGEITFLATERTHTRLSLPGALTPRAGALVPDTCRKAKVVVPVRGRTVLVVRFPEQVAAPATLVAEHRGTFVLPGHDAPRTHLERKHVMRAGATSFVRYEGWFRTDVPAQVKLHVPGEKPAELTLDPRVPARFDATQ